MLIGEATFELQSALVPKAGMVLRGCGAARSVLKAAASWLPGTASLPAKDDPSAYLVRIEKTDGVQLLNLGFVVPQLHGSIYVASAAGFELANSQLSGGLWAGLRTVSVTDMKIHDNDFLNAGGKVGNIVGGSVFTLWPRRSLFWNNRIRQSPGTESSLFGFKGAGGEGCRFYNNDVRVKGFVFEFPHTNSSGFEIDHNYFDGAASIPKFQGGAIADGFKLAYDIHHNVFRRSYSFEFARNHKDIHHNVAALTQET